MQGGSQGPLRPGGEGDPNRSIYIARRIVAGIVVLLLLALVGNWMWNTLLGPEEQRGSETPEIASGGTTSSGGEETAMKESPIGSTEEIFTSQEGPDESLWSSAEVGTKGSDIESPAGTDLGTTLFAPQASIVPEASPTLAWTPEATLTPPAPNVPLLSYLPTQAPDTTINLTAQPPGSPVGGIQPLPIETIAFGEPPPSVETGAFEEEVPLWASAFEEEPRSTLGTVGFEEETDFGGSSLVEMDGSSGATATAGNTVAVAGTGGGAIAKAGNAVAVAGSGAAPATSATVATVVT
jgi:hypothetical protein